MEVVQATELRNVLDKGDDIARSHVGEKRRKECEQRRKREWRFMKIDQRGAVETVGASWMVIKKRRGS